MLLYKIYYIYEKTHLICSHDGTLPIVQIILEIPVTDSKLKLLQESLVFH